MLLFTTDSSIHLFYPGRDSAQANFGKDSPGISGRLHMEQFNKKIALDVIEDALACMDTPHARGMAIGLCGAFYMCGLLSAAEWRAFLKRIPAESDKPKIGDFNGMSEILGNIPGRYLN